MRPLSKVISWIFLQREAIWPLCVQIKSQYGAEAPSLMLSQGSRELQQSTAMLARSLWLIGFDIEKWPPATFSKNTDEDRLENYFSNRYHPLAVFLFPITPLCGSLSGLWGFMKSVSLHWYSCTMTRSQHQLEFVSVSPVKTQSRLHWHCITSFSQTTHKVTYIIYVPDGQCSWSGFIHCLQVHTIQLHFEYM